MTSSIVPCVACLYYCRAQCEAGVPEAPPVCAAPLLLAVQAYFKSPLMSRKLGHPLQRMPKRYVFVPRMYEVEVCTDPSYA
jgi:hypothetical protein